MNLKFLKLAFGMAFDCKLDFPFWIARHLNFMLDWLDLLALLLVCHWCLLIVPHGLTFSVLGALGKAIASLHIFFFLLMMDVLLEFSPQLTAFTSSKKSVKSFSLMM